MALQVSTGPGSLVALGINVGDVATLYGLAKRMGNWLTAASGDQEFLDLLDQDEMDIMQRRGLIDVLRFNKRWGSRLTLLANGKPTTFTGKDAEKNIEQFSRFTATMVCVIAALEAFAPLETTKTVIKRALLQLLRTTEWGEDVVASQFYNRFNSWQSAAEVRGLSGKAREIRQSLISRYRILDGLMPIGDSKTMTDFLVWLLAGNTSKYITPSSDVAGVGVCLSELGIDILSVSGLGEEPSETPCQLEYSPQAVFQPHDAAYTPGPFSRVACTTVSLQNPEESLTKFPVDPHTSNRCRQAWIAGSNAAKAVAWIPVFSGQPGSYPDVKYAIYDNGSKPTRTRTKIGALVEALAFVINKEICRELEFVLQRESDATLDWILDQTVDAPNTENFVSNVTFNDQARINAFTVFQAFFMGYYYAIFLNMVDTSSLQLNIVDGLWGFRSLEFFISMRTIYLSEFQFQGSGLLMLKREDVICILSSLMCATSRLITRIKHGSSTDHQRSFSRDSWCVGVIGKRTLLVRSLLKPCHTRKDIGRFVLLDVDVSGIPRDKQGLVRPGIADAPGFGLNALSEGLTPDSITEAPNEDVTFHIEADWDGDPDNMLLCVRYKGRRTFTVNTAVADAIFGSFTTSPVQNPMPLSATEAIKATARDCLNRRPLTHKGQPGSFVLHIPDMPRLRYAIAYWYGQLDMVRLASNCLQTSINEVKSYIGRNNWSYIVISGSNGSIPMEDKLPPEIEDKIRKTRLHRKPGELSQTLLGDDRTQVLSAD